jgi:hypothetical protein
MKVAEEEAAVTGPDNSNGGSPGVVQVDARKALNVTLNLKET